MNEVYEIVKANYEVAKATAQAAEPIIKSTSTLVSRIMEHPDVLIGPAVGLGILLGVGIIEYAMRHEHSGTWHPD